MRRIQCKKDSVSRVAFGLGFTDPGHEKPAHR